MNIKPSEFAARYRQGTLQCGCVVEATTAPKAPAISPTHAEIAEATWVAIILGCGCWGGDEVPLTFGGCILLDSEHELGVGYITDDSSFGGVNVDPLTHELDEAFSEVA